MLEQAWEEKVVDGLEDIAICVVDLVDCKISVLKFDQKKTVRLEDKTHLCPTIV